MQIAKFYANAVAKFSHDKENAETGDTLHCVRLSFLSD